MKRVVLSLLAVLVFPARADIVADWIDYGDAVETAATPPGTPPTPEHRDAGTQLALAMFEAANAIDRRFGSYAGVARGDARASVDAAVAATAYTILSHHYPSQQKQLDDSLALTLADLPGGKGREQGRSIGASAAAAVLKLGGPDPAIAAVPYRPGTTPGVWVPTALPVIPPWAVTMQPWVIGRADALRPGPPPALTSAEYTRDFNEVKTLGARNSTVRTPNQTLIARFRITPNLTPMMRHLSDLPGRTAVQNARLFALMTMADADSGLAVADAKLHYGFWRPITAIRNAADDGNPDTAPDAAWEPLLTTPNHPEYPCGHCIHAAAEAAVLTAEFGDRPPGGVRVTSERSGGAVQVVPSLAAWVALVSNSRIWGGVHYRFSAVVAEDMGRRAAAAVLTKLRPLR